MMNGMQQSQPQYQTQPMPVHTQQQQQHQPSPPTNTPQPFGLILPGKNVQMNFTQADASGTKFTLLLPFIGAHETPTKVSDLVLFLLPNMNLPSDQAAMVYWSATSLNPQNSSPTSEFQLLGALTPTKPSAVFRTGWSTHQTLLDLIESSSQCGVQITVGISLEPLAAVKNLEGLERGGVNDRQHVGKKIALDLFNFLKSFDDSCGNGGARAGWMTVPTNVFDRWWKRFETKIQRDPNFFMKNSD
jgi:hypothetical protein